MDMTDEYAASERLLEKATPNGREPTATLAELRGARQLYVTMPSGAKVRIRPPNMDVYALAGGLPARLRPLTTPSSAELNRRLTTEAQTEKEVEANKLAAEYLVEIARLTIVEPDLSKLTTFEELDEILLPVDFHWLLQIGQRETDVDGTGKRMWGVEPLDRWRRFRDFHGCAEDCPACLDFQREFSVARILG